MSKVLTSNVRHAAIVAALFGATATLFMAGPAAAGKYERHTVSQKASFHTLQKHAHSLEKAGLAKVAKIKRHGRVVGFEKKFTRSGDTVIVKRGRHGRVKTTTLRRRSLLQRWKSRFSFRKARHPRYLGKGQRRAFNGFRHRRSRLR